MIFSIGETTAAPFNLSNANSKDFVMEGNINNYNIYTYKEGPSFPVISPGVFTTAVIFRFSRGVALNVNNLCINWR
jgi:hypothetical protein